MNPVKLMYWHFRARTRAVLKHPAALVARLLGYRLLTKKQTSAYLAPSLLATHAGSVCALPAVADAVDPARVIFAETEVKTAPVLVWRYECADQPTSLLRCGLLLTRGQVLNTDYWTDDALDDVFRPRLRKLIHTSVLLAPLGHYFEGNKFVGYYDFIFLIAAKVCRIKEAAPADDFQAAVVAYPLVGTSYEREFWHLMGFGPDCVFDSRQADVRADVCYLGNHDNWMYPSRTDILLLRKHLKPLIHTPRTAHNRIYVSRTGRRRVLNEAALTAMLTTYGFLIIEDKPRSLTEQYAIYHNASFIMGPHGASFSNLLWCEPGTQLLELFTARFAQTHFQYLAQVLNLPYAAYCQDTNPRLDYGAIASDITVSVPDLERYLAGFFGKNSPEPVAKTESR